MSSHLREQIRITSEGEELVVRPRAAERITRTIIQAIWTIGIAGLLYWSAPALVAYFERGEITGAARHLDRFELSDKGILASVVAWCFFLAWWGLGSLYEIIKINLKQDRFILGPDLITVFRRNILTRSFEFRPYETLAVRIRHLDGALEAVTPDRSCVLTEGGTELDRHELLEILQHRYRVPQDLPIQSQSSIERVGTYIVERFAGGLVKISSSKLSTVGCAVIAAVMCVILAGFSIWLFRKGESSALIPMFIGLAIAVAGLSSLNQRQVEVSHGHIRVKWRSPVGSFLRRFSSSGNLWPNMQMGEGEYEATDGILKMKIGTGKNRGSSYSIVLVESESPAGGKSSVEDLSEQEDSDEEKPFMEHLILSVHGHDAQHAATFLLRLIEEATGFRRLGSDNE